MNNLLMIGVVAVVLAGSVTAFIVISLWFRKEQLRRSRSPFTKELLRLPGESLRRKIDNLFNNFLGWYMLATIWPVLMVCMYLAQHFERGHNPTSLIVYTVALVLGLVISLWRLVVYLQNMRDYRLGLDGEMATGEMLNELRASGCHVYHDIPAKYGNIDHVVVGPGGVFAVETKARSKPTRGKGKHDATARFDGDKIQFPNYVETRALAQARRQARWAAKWLSDATDDMVKVCPVVALPGWWVDRTSRSDVLVLNPEPSQTRFMAQPGGHGRLAADKIQRIKHQIEQKNRDVAPSSRNFD